MRRSGRIALLWSLLVVSSGLARVAPPVTGPAKDTPRLQKLRQLTYDRRPSAILKAWAPQPLPKKTDKDKKPDPLDEELAVLQRQVTIGDWAAVKKYLAGLPADEGKAGFEQMLRSLQGIPGMPGMAGRAMPGMPMGMPMNPAMMQYAERNRFSPDDVVGLAAAAPLPLDRETLRQLGPIVRQCVDGGIVIEAVVARLRTEASKPNGAVLSPRQVSQLLVSAGHAAEAGAFLPTLAQAQKDRDIEAINLLAQHYLALHDKEKKLALLEQAWASTQSALALPASEAQKEDQRDALKRAVELAPRLKEELGQAWLDQSFTREVQRGMTILSTIGELSAQGLQRQPQGTDDRLRTLKLQKTAVEALLRASPERARAWQDTLTLLAGNWLREAEFTHRFATSSTARMRRDRWGNIYFLSDDYFMGGMRPPVNPNQPRPIDTIEMLAARPGQSWLARVSPSLRPRLSITICQLHLKADEEKQAFPYVEELARSHPKQAKELADEFLRVWTRNHDLNAARRYTNPYMFMYGFERRSDGIPLTRSKQERNLVDLGGWVARLRKLPIGDPDEEQLAKAFTACHSSAEVYRAEAIRKVFGPLEKLKPRTLSGLAQQMRENLAGVWRRPEEQKDKKTNRKTRDIQAEVKRGYEVARTTVDEALKKFPADWSLVLARAAILHDEVSFLQELKKSTTFAPLRQQAYAEFARSAKLYVARVKELPEDEQSTRVFEQWFYASLGACDLGMINEEKVPDLRQPARIRQALLALPGELAEKHRERFAKQLFTRMSAVKPEVKFRYLKGGFEIVGDHKDAAEAKKVYDYYKDLVSEIKLETRIDGPAVVGHRQPFGVFVWLRHTRDIERESGGFGRYLQNQNTNTYFSWNYGRPTVDYRDRFQTAATEALKEHFEVLSLTFETDKVHSRADQEYGWRITPYAYLLLKPRGPQVDRLPPLRIDLDFLDTSGYVVLPVESAAIPLDARPEKGEPRPARKIQITQTLDERQADRGKLILEVKATATGLVPELDRLLEVRAEGFAVEKTEDQGVSVSKFEQEVEGIGITSERTWLVTLKAGDDLAHLPKTFTFGKAKAPDVKMTYQRYDDADLAVAEPVVDLERSYGQHSRHWMWWAGGAAVLAVAGAALAWRLRGRQKAGPSRWALPEPLTPFTAITLLERIRRDGGLSEPEQAELVGSIGRLERHYFGGDGNGEVDLKQVAEGWVRRAR
jgi:hypothetical protein